MVWEAGQTVPLKVSREGTGKIHTSGSNNQPVSRAESVVGEAGSTNSPPKVPWGKAHGEVAPAEGVVMCGFHEVGGARVLKTQKCQRSPTLIYILVSFLLHDKMP